MAMPVGQTDHPVRSRELRRGFWTYFAVLLGCGWFGSYSFYLFLFPLRPEIIWGRYVALGLSLLIYYALFFSPLTLRVTSEGLEARGLILKKVVRWEEIQEVILRESYAYSGSGAPGMPLFSSNVLKIIGTRSKLEFSFGPTWGKLHKEGLPWVLDMIFAKTGKSPTNV